MKMLNLRAFPKFVTLAAVGLFACGIVFAAPKVTIVNCSDANGNVLGYFTKKADGTWYEQGYGDRVIDAGKNYTQYNEDEWSYYLF